MQKKRMLGGVSTRSVLSLQKQNTSIVLLSQVSYALDLARGLQALHEAPGGPIVHFDIKPQQMMLDAGGKLRINDLNLVRFPDADKDGNSCPFKCGASGVGECWQVRMCHGCTKALAHPLWPTFRARLLRNEEAASTERDVCPDSRRRDLSNAPPPFWR